MTRQASVTHSSLRARTYKALDMQANEITDAAVVALAKLGMVFDHAQVKEQIRLLGVTRDSSGTVRAMDSNFTAPVTTASVPTPVQFLQTWLPGFVKVLTAARKIDEIVGIKTVGSWEDQEIVQGIVEPAGSATEYGDLTDIPLTSWNTNFEKRTIVRGELGLQVGLLEEGRAAAMRLSSAETKRQQAAVGLEILRNAIGFFGWSTENGNRTFGFLNDPNLPAFITAPSGGWATADFAAMIGDIRFMVQRLRIQSQDQVDPKETEITLALPTSKVDFLSITTDFGISVSDWIKQTYPKMRIVSAPELQEAASVQPSGFGDVAYMFAEKIESSVDGSTDGGETFAQLVQTKLYTLGVEKRVKNYLEGYSNGTAGVLCKRPYAVVRLVGI